MALPKMGVVLDDPGPRFAISTPGWADAGASWRAAPHDPCATTPVGHGASQMKLVTAPERGVPAIDYRLAELFG